MPQLKLMAEAADRVEATRSILLMNMIAAGGAAGFGGEIKAMNEIQTNLRKVIDG